MALLGRRLTRRWSCPACAVSPRGSILAARVESHRTRVSGRQLNADPLGGMRRAMSSARAGLIFLALTFLDVGLLCASMGGYIEKLESSDLMMAPISIGLGVATSLGLLRRRLWGWWAGIASVFVSMLELVVFLALDPDLGPASIAAFGLVWILVTILLALLDAPSVRTSLTVPPPSTGLFARLPVQGCLSFGIAVVALAFTLTGAQGWLFLLVWLLIRPFWRMRRRHPHAA